MRCQILGEKLNEITCDIGQCKQIEMKTFRPEQNKKKAQCLKTVLLSYYLSVS